MHWIFSFFSIFLSLALSAESKIPSFEETRDALKKSESLLLDRNGKILAELRTYPKERRLEWVPLEELSPYLLESVRIAEDKKFYEHKGVDWMALGSGVLRTLSTSPARGASTITMQLAGILTEKFKPRKRNLFQKWNQIQLAQEMEETWTKEQIMEAYLNLVWYRGELVGAQAASLGLFQKKPHGLNTKEGILLAAMIKNPSFSLNRLIRRACYIQKNQYGIEDCSELKEFAYQTLNQKYKILQPEKWAYHLARSLLKRGEQEHELETTLIKEIQMKAIESCQKRMLELKSQNVKDCAILVIENETGNVLAYVGSSGKYSLAPEIDGILSKRQAGSTLKPFIYGIGLEKKIITPASILEDKPIPIQVGTGIYNPGNYEGYHGDVSARVALASSLNAPAIRVLDMVGLDEAREKLEDLGFGSLKEAEFYGLSLALGSLDVSLWDLVQAFSVFPNQGVFRPIRYLKNQTLPEKRVYLEETSFLISHILKDREARALSFGLDNPLATRIPASVKTGTSKDMRDNWCVGYTKDFTVGVWVGNHSGEPMWNVSGVTGAAPIWSELIQYLHIDNPVVEQKPPKGLVQTQLMDETTGIQTTEWFFIGTETNRTKPAKPMYFNGIKKPIKDTIYSIDPDIPSLAQSLSLEAKIPNKDLIWFLNQERIGNAGSPLFWNLKPGIFHLELKSKDGKLVDKLKFEVK